MPKLQIKNSRTNIILYEGVFATVKDCLEQAVQERVCLDYADLRHANLANGALDDIAKII
ncbi:MAG: hypothetical protein CO093_01695 [Alphaproteobacteria bacterium CG_4_9_14_3_um_filter_47_13]|nr:MAG: hypothetical protein CO093_01695 [Alphaproteobacteria bacterium CG_4_9_14_3_um_filter_47_13]